MKCPNIKPIKIKIILRIKILNANGISDLKSNINMASRNTLQYYRNVMVKSKFVIGSMKNNFGHN